MSEVDDSYQVRIYTEAGVEDPSKRVYKSDASLVITSGARIRIGSSGILQMSEGGLFTFQDTSIEAEAIQNAYLGNHTITQHGAADTTGAKSMVPAYGIHIYSMATTLSLGSILIASASKGMTLYIDGVYLVGDANLSVITDSTVGLVVNARGSDLSSLEMSAAGFVELICTADGTWSIIGQNNVIERPSS